MHEGAGNIQPDAATAFADHITKRTEVALTTAARDAALEPILRELSHLSAQKVAAEYDRRGLGKISYRTVMRGAGSSRPGGLRRRFCLPLFANRSPKSQVPGPKSLSFSHHRRIDRSLYYTNSRYMESARMAKSHLNLVAPTTGP